MAIVQTGSSLWRLDALQHFLIPTILLLSPLPSTSPFSDSFFRYFTLVRSIRNIIYIAVYCPQSLLIFSP